MDPKELEALAEQLDEELEDAHSTVPPKEQDRRLAFDAWLAALVDARDALRTAAAECRKAHGL
jgi:hypothetical protein